MNIDYKLVQEKAQSYADDMTKFLCDLIALPRILSGEESSTGLRKRWKSRPQS